MSEVARDAELAERVARSLPAAGYELETLCRLAGIGWSRNVRSASVTCGAHTRLLVNPDFVAEHCRRDEHLFLLVMHEIWHVLLAHTKLYDRPTRAHNVAFDAIINAGLARQHSAPEYLEFFESLNRHDVFPQLLLRPPVDWPDAPKYDVTGPEGTAAILESLYPAPGRTAVEPTFDEILSVLSRAEPPAKPAACEGAGGTAGHTGENVGQEDAGGDRSGGDDGTEPTYLGDHDDDDAEARDAGAMRDEVFGDVVRRIVANWPPPPFPLCGRDAGRSMQWAWGAVLEPPGRRVQVAFAAVLRRSLGNADGQLHRRRRVPVATVSGPGVLMNPRDRLAPARRLLGAPTTLWAQPATTNARVRERIATAHVYVDVSGSMLALLPHILGLLLPYVARREADVYQFSTEVAPLPLGDLRSGRMRTTFGTSIECVLRHMLAAPLLRSALVLTDGYVGAAPGKLAADLARRDIELNVVLPHESPWENDLKPIAHSITVLPLIVMGGGQ